MLGGVSQVRRSNMFPTRNSINIVSPAQIKIPRRPTAPSHVAIDQARKSRDVGTSAG